MNDNDNKSYNRVVSRASGLSSLLSLSLSLHPSPPLSLSLPPSLPLSLSLSTHPPPAQLGPTESVGVTYIPRHTLERSAGSIPFTAAAGVAQAPQARNTSRCRQRCASPRKAGPVAGHGLRREAGPGSIDAALLTAWYRPARTGDRRRRSTTWSQFIEAAFRVVGQAVGVNAHRTAAGPGIWVDYAGTQPRGLAHGAEDPRIRDRWGSVQTCTMARMLGRRPREKTTPRRQKVRPPTTRLRCRAGRGAGTPPGTKRAVSSSRLGAMTALTISKTVGCKHWS